MSSDPIRRRDTGLRRINRFTKGALAGGLALTGGLSVLAARSFSGATATAQSTTQSTATTQSTTQATTQSTTQSTTATTTPTTKATTNTTQALQSPSYSVRSSSSSGRVTSGGS